MAALGGSLLGRSPVHRSYAGVTRLLMRPGATLLEADDRSRRGSGVSDTPGPPRAPQPHRLLQTCVRQHGFASMGAG